MRQRLKIKNYSLTILKSPSRLRGRNLLTISTCISVKGAHQNRNPNCGSSARSMRRRGSVCSRTFSSRSRSSFSPLSPLAGFRSRGQPPSMTMSTLVSLRSSRALHTTSPYRKWAFTNFACFQVRLWGLRPLDHFQIGYRCRRNGGIRKPEMRLPVLIPYLIMTVIGEVIADHQWPWEPIVIGGYFFTSFQVSMNPI